MLTNFTTDNANWSHLLEPYVSPPLGQRVNRYHQVMIHCSLNSSTLFGYRRPSRRRDCDKPDKSANWKFLFPLPVWTRQIPTTNNYQKRCCYHYCCSLHTNGRYYQEVSKRIVNHFITHHRLTNTTPVWFTSPLKTDNDDRHWVALFRRVWFCWQALQYM